MLYSACIICMQRVGDGCLFNLSHCQRAAAACQLQDPVQVLSLLLFSLSLSMYVYTHAGVYIYIYIYAHES